MTTLRDEIPPGAEITVVLRNGTKFTGTESTHPDLAKDGVLRIERPFNPARGLVEVFFTTASELAAFTMIYEEA